MSHTCLYLAAAEHHRSLAATGFPSRLSTKYGVYPRTVTHFSRVTPLMLPLLGQTVYRTTPRARCGYAGRRRLCTQERIRDRRSREARRPFSAYRRRADDGRAARSAYRDRGDSAAARGGADRREPPPTAAASPISSASAELLIKSVHDGRRL